MSHLVANYEEVSGVKVETEKRHHKQSPTYQKSFLDNVKKLTNTLEKMGNPFQEETGDLLCLDTKDIAPPQNAERISTHYSSGMKSFQDHLKVLLLEDTSSFYAPVKKTKLKFFEQESPVQLQRRWL